MKKYLKLLMVAIFAAMSFTLVSCGGDDDDDEPDGDVSKEKIVGTWKVNTMKIDDSWYQIDYDRFNADGTYTNVTVVTFMGEEDVVVSDGKWSVSGNTITIDGVSATIKSISDSKMVVSTELIDIIYNRCSESEMDKYLK